ncbi:hypothetical protein BP5796_06202 [Coleophoma crateriformis]|uniref:DUF6594 domain-containing protein n=1 Tax=Coleophoma crateriformis TaxID=565419 RepID=A0A3D8RWN9_9HELO|nr:hypothetical protein BP5796_06202 [Coleophoma crateriformis]
MSGEYIAPSIGSILETCEDEARAAARFKEDDSHLDSRRSKPSHDPAMSPTKANTGKERDSNRRSHKGSSSTKHTSKSLSKNTKRTSVVSTREQPASMSHLRHRRMSAGKSESSSSSSSESSAEESRKQRTSLTTARGRLTSPSMISNLTSLTSSTNKSSGSSGSNSTVTQASISKRSSIENRSHISDAPLSPACPDPPNVFAYLEKDSDSDDNHVELHEAVHDDHEAQWSTNMIGAFPDAPLPAHLRSEIASSSASSYRGDDTFSEPAADNDTDRSTSPERSVQGRNDAAVPDTPQEMHSPTDSASAKVASQLAAAHQRQDSHANLHSFGTPDMRRGNAVHPHIPGSALSPRYINHNPQRSLPRGEKLPVTGYEQLASTLSAHRSDEANINGEIIKPMYRKFEALNHRLLLHLQDEISELEEHLHRLDTTDTQTRRMQGKIMPASRRTSAQIGGELQWHKVDVLGKIGYKLAQYSMYFTSFASVTNPSPDQALTAFNTTQQLKAPAPTDIKEYQAYLSKERLIAENETRFLEQTNDLVFVRNGNLKPPPSQTDEKSAGPFSKIVLPNLDLLFLDVNPGLLGVAASLAMSVLVPILTFSVIPDFIGRMTVVLLVALGLIGGLFQSGIVGRHTISKEGMICCVIYGGVMVVIAGIMS